MIFTLLSAARAGKSPGLRLPPDPGDKTAKISSSTTLSDALITLLSG
ncbi:Hypothetical protein EAG7_04187 [Klebsiella aerogenes]|jgi:hypothetical protein|nr:Hypothetical protein EAG7_04187 [Klebsiella aerogenes]CCG32682.1 hypothetical protein [Klebsiella aerogenes EA1509E]